MLYRSANNLVGGEWQKDPAHTCSIYSKLYDSLYPEGKAELMRRVDANLENNTLTIDRLKKEITEISKMTENRIEAEVPESVNVMKETDKTENPEDQKTGSEGKGPGQEQVRRSVPKCWNCDKPGHFRSECNRPKRFSNFGSREPKGREDGRQAYWRRYGHGKLRASGNQEGEKTQETRRYGGRYATRFPPQ